MSGPQADFHRLEKFKDLDFGYFMPKNAGSDLSALWLSSIAESKLGRTGHVSFLDFKIQKTWDDKPIDHDPVEIKLISGDDELIIQMKAPYFDDPAPDGAKPGEAFYKLWDYEVVEAFFLNDKNQYLELEFGPHGQHLALLLNGNRNAVK